MDFTSILENKALLTLSIYIVLLVPLMLLGFFFARRKMFNPQHKLTMTSVVILNWILIGFIMAGSYAGVAEGMPDNISEPFALIATIHGLIGLTAQVMATYLVLLMWTENTPLEGLVFFRIKNIKTPMRLTLGLWLITVLFGFGVYGIWHGGSDTTGDEDVPPAIVTEEAESGDVDGEETEVEDENLADPDATEESDLGEESEANVEETEDAPEPDTTEEAD